MSFLISHPSSSPDDGEEAEEEEEQDEEEDEQGLGLRLGLAEADDVALHVSDFLPLLIGSHSFLPWMQQSHRTWLLSFFGRNSAFFFVLIGVALFRLLLFFWGSLSEAFSLPVNSVTDTPNSFSTEAIISCLEVSSRFFSVKNKRLMESSSSSLGKKSFTVRLSPFPRTRVLLHITVWYFSVCSLRNNLSHRSHLSGFPLLDFASKLFERICALVLLSCSPVFRLMFRLGDWLSMFGSSEICKCGTTSWILSVNSQLSLIGNYVILSL